MFVIENKVYYSDFDIADLLPFAKTTKFYKRILDIELSTLNF